MQVQAFLDQRGEDFDDCSTFTALVSQQQDLSGIDTTPLIFSTSDGVLIARMHVVHAQVERAQECELATGPPAQHAQDEAGGDDEVS